MFDNFFGTVLYRRLVLQEEVRARWSARYFGGLRAEPAGANTFIVIVNNLHYAKDIHRKVMCLTGADSVQFYIDKH